MGKKIIIIALLILVIAIPVGAVQFYNFLLRPPASQKTAKIFVVKPGQPLTQIAGNLEKAGLIKNAIAFRFLISQMGIEKTIQAGDYRLYTNQSARDIAKQLVHGALDVWITFPEGLRVEEQAVRIEQKLNTPENDNYHFDKKQYISLAQEGFMFPDTYLVPKGATAKDLADKLRGTFDQKVDSQLLTKGAKNNLTPMQLITLASIIEREAKTDEEKPTIAGIIINRLKAGIALQVDATVQYAMGYDSAKNSWWPQVSVADYKSVISPYNAYLNPGLPPGPICSPGLSSIEAAANPQDTPYVYYLHDSKGKIHYAKTGAEHADNIKKYL